MVLTQEKLEEKLKEWQKILKLQDWDVKVKICRQHEFRREGQAECIYVVANKEAFIRILDPIDWTDTQWEQDMERSLVHELIHLHTAPFDDFDIGSKEDILLEQATDLLSKAFVSLKRGETPCSY